MSTDAELLRCAHALYRDSVGTSNEAARYADLCAVVAEVRARQSARATSTSTAERTR